MNIDYRIESLDESIIYDFCLAIKKQFPYMFPHVELDKYAQKLSKNALFISSRNAKNEIVGLLSFYMNNNEFAYVTLAAVFREYQMYHMFSKMLYLLKAKCICQNYRVVKLEVAKENEIAQMVYKKSGFENDCIKEDSIIMKMNV